MSIEGAINDVAQAISRAALRPGPVEKDHAAALLDLANAAAALKFGPQGYVGRVDYDYRNKTDYHYTTHGGEVRTRPAGFEAAE